MKKDNLPIEPIKQPIKRVTSNLWFEQLTRLGYAVKGLIYFIVGLFCFCTIANRMIR